MLVATPGRVSTLLEAEALNLEDCRAVVLDEVHNSYWVVPLFVKAVVVVALFGRARGNARAAKTRESR